MTEEPLPPGVREAVAGVVDAVDAGIGAPVLNKAIGH